MNKGKNGSKAPHQKRDSRKRKHRIGLKWQFTAVIIVGMLAAMGAYQIFDAIGLRMIDIYNARTNSYARTSDRYEERLQGYVNRDGLRSDSREELDQWLSGYPGTYIVVERDGELIYDSINGYKDETGSFVYAEQTENSIELHYYDWKKTYQMTFADGDAQVTLWGFYNYESYRLEGIAITVLSGVVLLLICIVFIQLKIRRIRQLESEIGLMEGGCLEHEIRIRGVDEIAGLGEGLDQMRRSFKNNIELEEQLRDANARLVTGISHDLRTPLTTLLLYMDLIADGKYKNEEEMQRYLRKSSEKAKQIKQLSDQLFERFFLTNEKPAEPEAPQKMSYVFVEPLSDMVMFLESRGYQVETELEWQEISLAVSTDYINRIMDNISSNISKYAEPAVSVRISSRKENRLLWLTFSNQIAAEHGYAESTGVGIANVKFMMEKMGGECRIREEAGRYQIELGFAVTQSL